ncbi:cell wall-active antibiotics response protein LiaF [Paenibacillus sp. NPDC058174]|uniref:cell wall-active antibiotics response protein LiaF n=1 Tax=Paenibacillus sp. NPDC058174 TaxID=3346366 RepID=UPI0036DB408A
MNGNFINRLFIGVIVIAVGVLFLLRQTGQLDFDFSIGYIVSTYWPVILIYFGLQGVLSGAFNGSGSGWWGGIMLLIGFVFLGRNLDWFSWSVGDIAPYIWPIIIILIGINMIRRPKKRKRRSHSQPKDDWKSFTGYTDSQGHVPPAPPLHPDPTKPGEAQEEERSEPKQAGYAEDDFKKHHDHSKRHGRHHHHHHETEYWNYDANAQTRSGFIGDIHIGHDYWELKPMNISHFIGDTVVDLTKAQIPFGETRLCISSFVGDVKVYVPNDYEVGIQVISSAFVGDVKILGEREGGFFKNVNIYSPAYNDTDKRIKLVVSTFVGDVRVTKVG